MPQNTTGKSDNGEIAGGQRSDAGQGCNLHGCGTATAIAVVPQAAVAGIDLPIYKIFTTKNIFVILKRCKLTE